MCPIPHPSSASAQTAVHDVLLCTAVHTLTLVPCAASERRSSSSASSDTSALMYSAGVVCLDSSSRLAMIRRTCRQQPLACSSTEGACAPRMHACKQADRHTYMAACCSAQRCSMFMQVCRMACRMMKKTQLHGTLHGACRVVALLEGSREWRKVGCVAGPRPSQAIILIASPVLLEYPQIAYPAPWLLSAAAAAALEVVVRLLLLLPPLQAAAAAAASAQASAQRH